MLRAESLPRPGGLNLADPVDVVGAGGAIDLLDVDWDGAGNLRSRPLPSIRVEKENTATWTQPFAASDTRLLTRRSNELREVIPDGTEVHTLAGFTSETVRYARLGTPNSSQVWIAAALKEGAAQTLKRWTAAAGFTSPTVTVDGVAGKAAPKGRTIAAWPDGDNRIVVGGTDEHGGPNGATSDYSTVWFSEPGNPEGYESTAFARLTPGDEEDINDTVLWGGKIFVFKESKFFVFYGVAEDEEGRPEFLFRSIDSPSLKVSNWGANAQPLAVAGSDGVYFLTQQGIMVTNGGPPQLIAPGLAPLGSEAALPSYVAGTFKEGSEDLRWQDALGLTYHEDCLYVSLGFLTGTRLLKGNLRTGDWSVWNVTGSTAFFTWAGGNTRTWFWRSLRTVAGQDATLQAYLPYTTDDSVEDDAAPRYRSGFYDLGSADEKALTHLKLFGQGTLSVKTATDYGALGTGREATMGAAPSWTDEVAAPTQRRLDAAQKGTVFSHEFSGTGPWWIQRVTRYLESTQVPASETR